MEYYQITERELWLLRGTSWGVEFNVGDEDGGPVNLSGYTAKFEILKGPTSEDALLECTTEDDITMGATSVLLEVPALKTNVSYNTGYFRLWIYSPEGWVDRLVQGTIRIG